MPRPADHLVDLSGLACPQLVLRLADALRGRPAGLRLDVRATDPLSAIDVPYFLERRGHRILARRREDEAIIFVIEIGPGEPDSPKDEDGTA